MGFTFRKSIRLPGGFRLNLSKSGVGASWGVPGLRVGTGPRGPRVSAYLPGTGIGWTTSLGGAAATRPARSARSAEAKDASRLEARERAAYAVAAFEDQIAALTTLHREPPRRWDWCALGMGPSVVSPTPAAGPREQAARAALQAYQPSAVERILGTDASTRRELEAAVENARRADAAEQHAATAQGQWYQHLAAGIVAGDLDAYEAAVQYLAPFPQIPLLGGEVEVTAEDPRWVSARFRANGREVVPGETLSLTPTGKLSTRKMPVSRAWSLYRDHLCSAVFRVARELFALLPIEVALVHARAFLLDPATGHHEAPTLVSAAFTRERFEALDLDHIEPTAAIEGFPHAMDFSPKRGLAPVEEIDMASLMDATAAG